MLLSFRFAFALRRHKTTPDLPFSVACYLRVQGLGSLAHGACWVWPRPVHRISLSLMLSGGLKPTQEAFRCKENLGWCNSPPPTRRHVCRRGGAFLLKSVTLPRADPWTGAARDLQQCCVQI